MVVNKVTANITEINKNKLSDKVVLEIRIQGLLEVMITHQGLSNIS
jgi:hypothetical protein